MNCERAQDLILLFLAGELATEEAEMLRPHLLTCAECTRHMSGQRRQLRMLEAAEEIEPSPGFSARTAATVARGLRLRRRAPLNRLASLPGIPQAAALAAALLLFVGLRWGPSLITDTPYDLSFLRPEARHEEAQEMPQAQWVDDSLAALREQIVAFSPKVADTPEGTATTGSDERWDAEVCGLTREAEILEWEVTSHGRTRWNSTVHDIEERLDALASGLERG